MENDVLAKGCYRGLKIPPRYETTYYTDYMIRYQARTYNVFDDQAKDAAE